MAFNDGVTVSFVIGDKYWKKDGTNFVRLRITFNRVSRYIRSNILVRKDQLTPKGKIRDSDLEDRIDNLIKSVRKSFSRLDTFSLQSMDIDALIKYLQKDQAPEEEKKPFRLDFFEFADSVIDTKCGQSQKTYRSAINSFKTYYKNPTMDISLLTSSMMRSYENWLCDKYGTNARAVSAYTACVAFIHGQARLRYNNEETGEILIRNPFQFYKPARQKMAAHRDVDTNLIQKMINLRKSLTGRERIGVDVFLISFALMGMNSPDLFSCGAPRKDVLHYYRTKTRNRRDDKAEMFVKIDQLVKELVAEYKSDDPAYAFKFNRLYTNYKIFGANVNKGLVAFCNRINYTGKVTLYSARHTWASVAYKAGVEKALINDGLCHVDKGMKVTDIYINKDWSVLWRANSKVLGKFKWEQALPAKPAISKKRMTSKHVIPSDPA